MEKLLSVSVFVSVPVMFDVSFSPRLSLLHVRLGSSDESDSDGQEVEEKTAGQAEDPGDEEEREEEEMDKKLAELKAEEVAELKR